MLQTIQITMPTIWGWFSNAFPDKNNPYGLIPDNSFTDKGITGFGITHAEMRAKRHSLIPMPFKPIIESKANGDCPYEALAVIGGVEPEDVAQYLMRKDVEFKKILVTPDSFWKVIEGAAQVGMLSWLYNEVFCYIDEVHCYAIDAFRGDNMLSPFRYVWNFKKKAFGSATPYPFSNPKFLELQHYKVRFLEKLGKISVVEHFDPSTALHYYLTNTDRFPGRVHIFYNTVTGTGKAIAQAGISDVSVFCAESDRNMNNLGEAIKYFRETIEEEHFKKVNFYTGRYFEGFDLIGSPLDTIIVITDTKIEHTLLVLEYRGVQAVGRLRLNKKKKERPYEIIHITNTLTEACNLLPEEVYIEKKHSAERHIEYYNQFKMQIEAESMTDSQDLKGFVSKFSYFDQRGTAKLSHEKIDQQVYAATFKRHYNSIESIVKRWQDSNFEVELKRFHLPKIAMCRKSDATINKQVIELFEKMKASPNEYNFGEVQRQMRQLQDKHDILFQTYIQFGLAEVIALGHDNKKMKAKLIETSNKNAEAKLRSKIANYFTIGTYTKKLIKAKLQEFYDELEMKKPDGKRKIATSTDLEKLKMFKMEDTKVEEEHAFKISNILFTVKRAA